MAVHPGRTGRNIIANFLGLGIASLLSLLLVPAYVGYIGIEAYALVGLFAVIQSWIALLDLGMTPTLGREMARYSAGTVDAGTIRTLLRSLETVYLVLALVIALLLFLLSDYLASRWLRAGDLPVEDIARALGMLGVVVTLRFCEGLYRGGLLGLQMQVWVNAVSTGLALLRSLGALAVLALISPTVGAFFIWQGLVSLLTVLVLGLKLHASIAGPAGTARFSLASLVRIRTFAGGVFATSLLSVLLTQVDKLLLSRLLPLAEFGYFMLASTLATGLWMIGAPVVLAVGPLMVRLHESRDEAALANAYHKASQLVSVGVVPAMLVLALFAPGVVLAWSGDPALAAGAGPILALLGVGTGLNALLQLPYQLQLAAGWTGLAMRVNLVAVLVMVPLLLWAVPRHGPLAAATVWAAINAAYLLVTIPLMHRRLLPAEMWRWLGRDILAPLGGAGIVLALAWLVQPSVAAGRWSWAWFLAATGLAALLGAALSAGKVREQLRLRLGARPRS